MSNTVLYVDDDRNLSQIVTRALRGEGYEVRTSFDGDDAIAAIREDVPDLVLLDILLPRRDGFEVLAEVRGLPGPGSQVPVVLVSGCSPTPAYAQRANELRANDLLAKPVPLEKLLEVVTEHLGEAKKPEPVRGTNGGASADGMSGSFERVPFPAILHHLHGLRATGVLHVTTAKKRKWIQMREGYPVAVRSNLLKETLGHFLERSGRISREVLEESRRRMEREGVRQGEILVAMERLSDEELAEALRDQADQKLFEIFSWDKGNFRFERSDKLQRANSLGIGRSPANLILQGVRSRFPIERIDLYLETHRDRTVAHGATPFYRFQEINLDSYQEALLRGLDGTQPLSAFLGEDEDTRRTVYGLIAAGLLELRGEGPKGRAKRKTKPKGRAKAARARASRPRAGAAPAAAAAAPRAPTSAPLTPEDESHRNALATMAGQLRARTYFEILGVDGTDPPDRVREAYERISGDSHPDRFAGSHRAVRDLALEVFETVTAAYETLADPRRRQQYLLDQNRAEREARRKEQSELALEAETEFRKGEVALNTRCYEDALRHFGRALELYPDEGDHHAHYGWALYLCHPGDASMVGEALEHVKRGLKLASHREKPYLFMGRLYKAIGKVETAEKMFTRAAHVQPECVEALRELRLINMRREKSKGLIGRLLRR